MRCSFVNLAFLFDDRQRAKSAELSFEHGARIEVFDFFGPPVPYSNCFGV